MKLSEPQIEQAIKDTFNEVYRAWQAQGDRWSEKQLEFIRVLKGKLAGRDVTASNVSSTDRAISKMTLQCPKCNKRCKSSSGLSLHIKRCDA